MWIESEALGGSQTVNTGEFSTVFLEVLNLVLQLTMNGVHFLLSARPIRSGFQLAVQITLPSCQLHPVATLLPAILPRHPHQCLPQ